MKPCPRKAHDAGSALGADASGESRLVNDRESLPADRDPPGAHVPHPPSRARRRREPSPPLIPARILNEYVYCPRLAYLEWVQKEWADSADTVEGRHVHRRVDKPTSATVPGPDESIEHMRPVRSVELSSRDLDLVAKVDLLEGDGGEVRPVDYKRGKRPHVAKHAYDPERVQLCAQGLLLEDHGYRCGEGVLYFAGSRERVTVPFDEELRQLTRDSIAGLRKLVNDAQMPPPLEDSPKCSRCSLASVCLPDEVNLLRAAGNTVRPLSVRHTRATPVYVQSQGAKVAKQGARLAVTVDGGEPTFARVAETSQLVLMGSVYVTAPALHELMRREIPVSWHSHGGWFLGHTVGTGHANVELRTAQYRGSFDEAVCLGLARGWVMAKIRNSRVFLRRNWRGDEDPKQVLNALRSLADRAGRARDLAALLGIEGAAAARYFQAFTSMFRDGDDAQGRFDMHNRNRRPPTDPVNAMLSFGYSLLVRAFLVSLTAVGFDPYRGFFHQPRYGRPALALDMMEPFRSLIVDSAVIMAVNNGEVRRTDFIETPVGTNLSPRGRKRFIAAFERRMGQEVTHPLFGYRVEYRRLLEIQSRLLGRFLLGEIPQYPNFTTR